LIDYPGSEDIKEKVERLLIPASRAENFNRYHTTMANRTTQSPGTGMKILGGANLSGGVAPSGGRKTKMFETPSGKPTSEVPNKTINDGVSAASPPDRYSFLKGIRLVTAVFLVLIASGGFNFISLQSAQAKQLAQQQENEETIVALVQQTDETKTSKNITAAVGLYQDAMRKLEERRSRPDITADPIQGTIKLESGFTPDPWPQLLQLQPDINLEDVGYYGYATSPPLINLSYEAGVLPLVMTAESTVDDLVMLVYAPDGEWYFNDDFSDLNPGFEFEYPESGTYMVWVGGYEQTTGNAILNISEVVRSADEDEIISETDDSGPDVGATPNYGDIKLSSGFSPDPYTQSATAGGSYDISEIGYSGFVSIAPDFDLYYTPGTYSLTIKAESSEDTILLINTPGGKWLYDDDYEGVNPSITIDSPEDGLYNIWIGSYGSENVDATLIITEL